MTKQNILKYVQTTPLNTNPTILFQMLDEFANENGGEGSSDITTTLQSVPSGSATITLEDYGGDYKDGVVDWFVPIYTTNYDYVDTLTLTVNGETYTYQNCSTAFMTWYVDETLTINTGVDAETGAVAWNVSAYQYSGSTVTIGWSATNIYTASSDVRAAFPNLFDGDVDNGGDEPIF